jgi:hypothetical protein
VPESLVARFGAGSGFVLGLAVFLVYLIYALGTNTFAFTRAAVIAGLVFIPLALAASAERQPSGSWQDFITIAGIWVAVKFSPSHWLWPYPGGRLAYVFTVLLCVNVALASFVLLRRINGIGYSIGWGRHWSFFVLASFVVFVCIAIPLGRAIHFIEFAPRFSEWKSLPLLSLGILFFTAWPEEFLFRGLLQEHAGARHQKRTRGLVDRFHSLWFLPHHQHGLSQLALRLARFHRRLFLWMDVAQDGPDLCFRLGPRRRGCLVAFFVSDNVVLEAGRGC